MSKKKELQWGDGADAIAHAVISYLSVNESASLSVLYTVVQRYVMEQQMGSGTF